MPGCKRFYQLLKETMGSTEVQSTLKSQMEFLGQMAKNMGYDVKSLMDFNNHKLWNAYDTLLVQKIHRKQLPSWANEDSIARLKFLMEYAVTAIFGIHKQEEKSRLQGGNLVKAILDKITKASQSNDEPKMVMYSAHDITIIALQIALGVFNRKLPPYSSCQFFELYKEGSGHTIEMYYRNSTYEQPHQLVLPSCTASCPLEKFKDLVSPIITNDWAGDCNK
ncbi:prostatic acid phosphatase-like isoform X2 [Hemicordylus capensis]|nr:prostatic acid phosphatase-like isoform X2 [Hemicordylus capensis]